MAESSSFYKSPVFTQEGESFVCFLNLNLSTLYIYCCSASLWQFDEIFPFGIDVIILEELISTKANMTKAKPFCAIILPLNNMKNYHSEEEEREKKVKEFSFLIGIKLCPNYPYTRKDRYLGLLNSGSTCYMATIIQILFHTGAFRQLIYSYKDPPPAPEAFQRLFLDLQLSSRAPTVNGFIHSLGPFNDLANVQNDANEFLIGILERLENDLGKTFTDSISQIFGGETKIKIVNNEKKYYEPASDVHRHYVVCLKCGKMEHINVCPVHDIKLDGFEVTGHRLELYGYCAECMDKMHV